MRDRDGARPTAAASIAQAGGGSGLGVLLLVMAGTFGLGVLLALVKGRGDGLGYYVGNLSAPYLVASFLAGSRVRSWRGAALLGVLAAWTTLVGFYLGAECVFGYLSGSMGRYYLEWFTAGTLSGVVVGVAGFAARTHRQVRFLLPASLLLEPIAVSIVRLTGRFGGTQLASSQLLAWTIEVLLGAAALVMTARSLRSRARHGHPRRV